MLLGLCYDTIAFLHTPVCKGLCFIECLGSILGHVNNSPAVLNQV